MLRQIALWRRTVMTDKKLSPELRRRLAAAVVGRETERRKHAINHIENVETMVGRMSGLTDDEAADYEGDSFDPSHHVFILIEGVETETTR